MKSYLDLCFYKLPFDVSLTVDVVSKTTITLAFDSREAYEIQYQMHIWGLGIDFTDSFTWWVVPYLGVVKDQGDDYMVELTSFAIGGGIITKTSDTDDDNLSDYQEIFIYQTEWESKDTESDGMPDGWEVTYGLDPLVNDANEDADNDRFSNFVEYQKGTIPNDAQSHPSRAMLWIPLLLED